MLYRVLGAVESWIYETFDRISALFTDDFPYPEQDALASAAPAPAFVRVPPSPPWGTRKELAS
jgi:hypothetical protein